jgi:hypothetical protein
MSRSQKLTMKIPAAMLNAAPCGVASVRSVGILLYRSRDFMMLPLDVLIVPVQ